MSRDRVRQLLVAASAIGQFAILGSLGSTFSEGNNFNELRTTIYFVPASYTFAVWGVILFLSATYATYQLRPDQTERAVHRRIGWWVALTTFFFSVWSVVAVQQGQVGTASYQPLAILGSVGAIIIMLIGTLGAFLNLRALAPQLTPRDNWLAVVPVAVYCGWLSVATIANITSYVDAANLMSNQFGAQIAIVLLIVALFITGAITLAWNSTHGAVGYAAVIMWASIGIAAENLGQSLPVTITALLVALAILLLLIGHINGGRLALPISTSQRTLRPS